MGFPGGLHSGPLGLHKGRYGAADAPPDVRAAASVRFGVEPCPGPRPDSTFVGRRTYQAALVTASGLIPGDGDTVNFEWPEGDISH